MRAILLLPVAAITAASLSGCGPASRGLETVHQPVVQRTDYAMDLQSGGDGLVPGEEQRLAAWFETLKLGFGDRVTVDERGSGQRGDARDAVGSIAARYGLLLDDLPPVTPGELAPGTVRVVVSRSAASVPGCPDWRQLSQPNFDGAAHSNFGCATSSNLAAMVADPQDLLHGRAAGAGGSTRATTRSLKAYNDLVPTGVGGAVKADSARAAGGGS